MNRNRNKMMPSRSELEKNGEIYRSKDTNLPVIRMNKSRDMMHNMRTIVIILYYKM